MLILLLPLLPGRRILPPLPLFTTCSHYCGFKQNYHVRLNTDNDYHDHHHHFYCFHYYRRVAYEYRNHCCCCCDSCSQDYPYHNCYYKYFLS